MFDICLDMFVVLLFSCTFYSILSILLLSFHLLLLRLWNHFKIFILLLNMIFLSTHPKIFIEETFLCLIWLNYQYQVLFEILLFYLYQVLFEIILFYLLIAKLPLFLITVRLKSFEVIIKIRDLLFCLHLLKRQFSWLLPHWDPLFFFLISVLIWKLILLHSDLNMHGFVLLSLILLENFVLKCLIFNSIVILILVVPAGKVQFFPEIAEEHPGFVWDYLGVALVFFFEYFGSFFGC